MNAEIKRTVLTVIRPKITVSINFSDICEFRDRLCLPKIKKKSIFLSICKISVGCRVLNNFLAYRRPSRKEETDHKLLSLELFELNDSVAKGFLFQRKNQSGKKGIMEHEEH